MGDMGKSHVDESKTVVVNSGSQPVTIDLSSDESEDEAEEVDDDDEEDEEQSPTDTQAASNDVEQDLDEASEVEADSDEEMAEADAVDAASDEEMADPEAEPTFGELLASRHPTEISISSALPPDASTLTIKSGNPVIPSGMSLGTVLTQALRTNDNNLLEARLHTLDITIVKNTIQRLDPGLAGALLSKLAERLASRPGRYGNLIAWVQWTCIAHGGAIAAQPDVTGKVRTLYQILGQRVRSMDSLLLLKGKLDMLDAQLRYRKDVVAQQGARRGDRNEPGMIYIEGADGGDNWDSEDEDDDLDEGLETIRPSKRAKGRKALEDLISEEGESENEDEDNEDTMHLENGVAEESEEDEDEDEDEDNDAVGINGVVDVEAEVSSAEESDPDDVGGEVADESESEVSSDEERSNEAEDSEMDSFINDGEIEMASDEDDVHVEGDSESEEVQAPPEPKSTSKSPKKMKGRKS